MKTRKFWLAWLMSLATVAVIFGVSSCREDDPDNPILPGDNTGEVSFFIAPEGGGTGSGTASDPVVAQGGDTLSVAITEKCSYTDPNGTVVARNPQAVIKLFTDGETLFVKDFNTLLSFKETIGTPSQSLANDKKTMQQLQTFNFGGKEITIDLAYEVYTYINSQNRAIELPYIKVNPAKYGATKTDESSETKNSAVAVRGIRLRCLAPPTKRATTITDSIAYEVTVSFTVGLESMNTKNADSRELALEEKFTCVVENVTEVPDPKMDFSYELAHKSGTKSASSPFNVTLGEPFSLEWQQTASYQYFSIADRTGMEVKYEAEAYVHIDAVAADTIWAKDITELEKKVESELTIKHTDSNPVENTGSQSFAIAGVTIPLNWGYRSYNPFMIEGEEVNIPYLQLAAPRIADVKVAEVPNGVLQGKKGKLYTVAVTIEQTLSTVNTSQIQSEPLQYVITLTAAIATEEPKLVGIKYRKDYQWSEPHDNIPLVYHYMVYRDSIFSDGSVHTTETRSGNTTMNSKLYLDSAHGKYNQTIEKIMSFNDGYNQEYATVYYFKVNYQVDEAYRNAKATRTIAVPDLSLVTCEERGQREPYAPDLWSHYPGYNPSAAQVGWYSTNIERINSARICYNYAKGGEFLTFFDISSIWYNHILYVKDDLNGGQLISFLGDASDIDDVDFRPQFDFKISEEAITMPTGEPAKVFTHTCVTTMLGKQFHDELVDTVYQYTIPPFTGVILE